MPLLRFALNASFVLVILSSGFAGCSNKGCTEMGCIDDLTVKLSIVGQQSLPSGVYVIDVATDVEAATLTCTLPTGSGTVSCCQGASTSISGCPFGDAGGVSRIDISITGEPQSVNAKVSRDGSAVGSHEFTPTYRTDYPNGPDCPGECRVAVPETFTL